MIRNPKIQKTLKSKMFKPQKPTKNQLAYPNSTKMKTKNLENQVTIIHATLKRVNSKPRI